MRDSNELAYAKQIATSLWERHYKEISPNWKPLDDLMLVLTQIDNMTVGLYSEKERPDEWPTVSITHKKFKAVQSAMPDEWEEWCDKIETAIVTRNKIKETFREMPRGS